jgi:hypothetical protein
LTGAGPLHMLRCVMSWDSRKIILSLVIFSTGSDVLAQSFPGSALIAKWLAGCGINVAKKAPPHSRARALLKQTGLYDHVYSTQVEAMNLKLEKFFATASVDELLRTLEDRTNILTNLKTQTGKKLPFANSAEAARALNLNPQGVTMRDDRLYVQWRSSSTSGGGIQDPGLSQPGIEDLIAGRIPGYIAIRTGRDDYLARTNTGLGGRYSISESYLVVAGNADDIHPPEAVLRERLLSVVKETLGRDSQTVRQGLRRQLQDILEYSAYRSLLNQLSLEKGYREWGTDGVFLGDRGYLPPGGLHVWATDRADSNDSYDFWLAGMLEGFYPPAPVGYSAPVQDTTEFRRLLQERMGPKALLHEIELHVNLNGMLSARVRVSAAPK